MADLVMLSDTDDVVMGNVRMAMMAQADDVLLISLSARGLRAKLKTLQEWCALNQGASDSRFFQCCQILTLFSILIQKI
jgi:hypothetical protein